MYSNDGEIFENLVGIMTLITLRQPRFARAFCDVRCHEELKQAFMSSQKNNPKVQFCVYHFLFLLSGITTVLFLHSKFRRS